MGHLQSQCPTKTVKLLLLGLSVANLLDLTYADPPYQLCPNNTNYNTSFQTNLKSLMSSIPSNASVAKQFNTSIGDAPEKVYAQFMCLNYVTYDTCRNCISTASEDILQLCPSDNEAVVWEETCQLRYSNRNFLGQLDVSGNIAKYNANNYSDPELFSSVVNETLSNLTTQAAFNRSNEMYAAGPATVTADDTVYAMVQCTTDLSPDGCNTCLQVAIENVLVSYFFRGGRLLSRSCYLRYELYAFYEGKTEPPAAQDEVTGKSNSIKAWMIIILAVLSAVLVLGVLGFLVYHLSARTRTGKEGLANQEAQSHNDRNQNNTSFQQHYFQGTDGLNNQGSPFMDLATIHAATGSFCDSNFLGQGGFGPVYKGTLRDGKEVAVKRLSSCSEQGTEEFKNEVLLIMRLQHKNLVRLLGFCVDGVEKLLVYEFMPNSSLDVYLFDPSKRTQLDWDTRLNIVNGIAKGILYLHEDSRLRIIHRDLKASNVLLDNDMNPKISDFGMARIFAGSEGEANTARIVGTYGYMAPEYAMEGLYSTKSDVFSFGVLLLEIITGRRNAGFHKSNRAPTLLAYAWQLWNERNELELVDPLLTHICNPDQFSRYMHIGLLCVQEDACDRPTMSSVVQMLKSETANLLQPERPAFSVGRFTEHYEENVSNCSVNGLTVSDVLTR